MMNQDEWKNRQKKSDSSREEDDHKQAGKDEDRNEEVKQTQVGGCRHDIYAPGTSGAKEADNKFDTEGNP